MIKRVKAYIPKIHTRHMNLIFESSDPAALQQFYDQHMVDAVKSLDELFTDMMSIGPLHVRLVDNGNEFIKWEVSFVW